MSRRIEYRLNDEQLSQIEQAINGSPYLKVRQRAIAVRMLHRGQKPEQVAEVMMVTSAKVYAWHKRWREAGLSGLQNQPCSGRLARADADYPQKLAQALEADPRQLGLLFSLLFTIWTINRLRLYLSDQLHPVPGAVEPLGLLLEAAQTRSEPSPECDCSGSDG